jgi:hypothetical protein
VLSVFNSSTPTDLPWPKLLHHFTSEWCIHTCMQALKPEHALVIADPTPKVGLTEV